MEIPPSPPVRSDDTKTARDDDAGQANVGVVTPPPTASRASSIQSDSDETFYSSKPDTDDFAFLFTFIGVSKEEDILALSKFLTDAGCRTLDDLAFIQADLFNDYDHSVTPIIQKKLLLVAEFLLDGGSLQEVGSMKELVKVARSNKAAARTSTSTGSSPSPDVTKGEPNTDIILLNVGGYRFTTTRGTLCRFPGVLEGMFSGRHENPARRENDGSYVIDRDGSHFQHILNYLRVGTVISLPPDADSKEALAIEADYYGLDGLVLAIRRPHVDIEACLPDDVRSMRLEEAEIRKAFQNGDSERFSEHRGLVPLFCLENGIQPLPLTYEPPKDTSNLLMNNLRKQAPSGHPVTAPSLEAFRTNFNREHPNVLHRLSDVLLEENAVIAGGAVLRALTSSSTRTANWWGEKSDIDIFVYGRYRAEANRIARRIFFALAVDDERWVVLRSRGVITMHNQRWGGRIDLKVQIVLRLYDSPTEVLLGFDVDCCCCAYDGRAVWVTPRWLRSIRTGINMLNPLHSWPNKPSYELRLAKYAYRGFSVDVPGLDAKRIGYNRIRQTDLGKLRGIARLLKVSFRMEESLNDSTSLPQHPRENDMLKGHVEKEYNEAEMLIQCVESGYDDVVDNVIVPSVYSWDGDDVARFAMWYENMMDFPLARNSREEAWAEIVDAGDSAPEGVPSLLLTAWDTEKKSREYLNSEMDKFDLDNIYYGEAYETAG